MATDLLQYLQPDNNDLPSKKGTNLFDYLNQNNQQQSSHGVPDVTGGYYDYTPSKYDNNILPDELPILEHIREDNQGVLDALGRSTANLIGKTGINVIGGTLGTVYGIGSAIANGEVSNLWDNALTTSLDKASEAVGDYFKVYKSADYEERSLLGRLFTHPIQFTDEFMDTLSFTTGAIVTELLTAGIASNVILPRALKYLKSLDRGADAADVGSALRGAGIAQKIGTAGTLTRQLATGAAWEASVEARHGAIEMKESMFNDAMNEYGVQDISELPEEVVNDIEDRASNAGLFTFLTNMALVGGSNMVQFPKIFGAGFNTSKRATNRIAQEAGEYVDTAIPRTKADRFIRNIATAAKNPFMEGLVEEGGQSVLSQTAAMYWDRKNDDEAKSEVDKFLHAFGTSLKDTYTTGEGWYEIGMGMLIGSLGAPGRGIMPGQRGVNPETGERYELWTGGIAGSFQERAREDAEVAEMVDKLNQSPELMKAMQANYDFLTTAASIQPAQDRALERDDTFMFQNYRDDMLHAWIDSRMQAGLSSDLDTQVEQLQQIPTEDFYVSFRGEEQSEKASEEDKLLFKQRMVDNLRHQINNTREAYNIVDSAYNGGNEDLRQELIYNVASAKNIDIREKDLNRAVSDLTSGTINDLFLRRSDETITVGNYLKQLEDRLNSEDITALEETEIQRTRDSLKNLDEGRLSLSLDEFNQLETFINTRPVEASLNLGSVVKLMNDSRKLRRRRQAFIDTYNKLFTEEGQAEFEKLQKDIQDAAVKEQQDREKAEAVKQLNSQIKKERTSVKNKAEKLKVDTETDDDNLSFTVLEPEGPTSTAQDTVSVEDRITSINNQWQAELDALKDVYDRNKLRDPNTPEPVDERQAINDKYQAQLDALQNENVQPVTPTVDQIESPEEVQDDLDTISRAVDNMEAPEGSTLERSLLTPEEEATLTSINNDEQYQQQKALNSDGLVRNHTNIEAYSPQFKLYDDRYLRTVGNTITSLNINYTPSITGDVESRTDRFRLLDNLDEQGNLVINENFDSRLQDPSQFKSGDTVRIIFPTYAQMLERGVQDYTEARYNQEVGNPDMTPIAFVDNDNRIIGYLPTVEGVRRNVAPEYVDAEVIKNQEIRRTLLENRDRNYTFKITNKSSGVPMFSQNRDSIYNKLGDGIRLSQGVEIAVFKNGTLLVGDNNPTTKSIKLPDATYSEDYFQEGVVYTIIPTADGKNSFAIPADISNVSESDADTILHMLDLFTANTESLIQERDNLAAETDFSDIKQLMTAINNIIYIDNDSPNHIFNISINKGDRKLRLGVSKDKVFNLSDIRKSETRNKIKSELQKRYYAVKTANMNKPYTSFKYNPDDQKLDVNFHNDYNDYLNNNRVILTNLQSEPIIDTDRRYFTAQSVIEISNPIEQQRQIATTVRTEEVAVRTPVTTEKKYRNPLGARFRGSTGKPNILEDFEDINIPNQNLQEEAENLMRTCKSG